MAKLRKFLPSTNSWTVVINQVLPGKVNPLISKTYKVGDWVLMETRGGDYKKAQITKLSDTSASFKIPNGDEYVWQTDGNQILPAGYNILDDLWYNKRIMVLDYIDTFKVEV